MNHNPSHSQMPEFGTNKSPTTSVLFQHPKPEEMKLSFWAKIKPKVKELTAGLFIVAIIVSVPLTVKSCSNDVDRQHAAALKYQLQFTASSIEGAR